MKKENITILVVNDDGISAPGIRHLVDAVKDLGEIIVVAPDKPQSGMGHAITISTPIRFNKAHIFSDVENYQCSGTPADCIKIAKSQIIKKKPDLCLSGINHGSNHSVNVLYSGTMSAAMEACLENIPSVGFSFQNHDYEADFSEVKKFVRIITKKVLEMTSKPRHFLLNVNFPILKGKEKFKGVRICKQAYGKFNEKYKVGIDPSKKKYFWLSGDFQCIEKNDDSDYVALKNRYISIVPVQFDLTNYELKKDLEQWEF